MQRNTRLPPFPWPFLGRPILSIRRNQLVTMEGNADQDYFKLLYIADCFLDLSSSTTTTTTTTTTTSTSDTATATTTNDVDNFLSIGWLRKLLDVFHLLRGGVQGHLFLGHNASQITKPPKSPSLTLKLLDRTVKALVVCNTITHNVEVLRQCQKLAEITILALKQSPIGEGQVHCAKKALHSLLTSVTIDDKDAATSRLTDRTWSFSQRGSASAASSKASLYPTKLTVAPPP